MREVARTLPDWRSSLAVVAHPDDESFGLGAVISTCIGLGIPVDVLCLTHGEASTLHGREGDLAVLRAAELRTAGEALGVRTIRLLEHPDGALGTVDLDRLTQEVIDVATEQGTDALLVFDDTGVTGHPDHMRATQAATAAAHALDVDVLAWTLPEAVAEPLRSEFGAGFAGRDPDDVDIVIAVDRARQRQAVECHPSQAVPGSALWRRLDLLGDVEHLRWLRRSDDRARRHPSTAAGAP